MKKLVFFLLLVMPCYSQAQGVMSGNYTVGGANPDFATVRDAATAVSASAVTAPVTISIRPGVYNDWMRILPYQGADSARTVTFRSETGKAEDVVINYNGPTNSKPELGTKPVDTNAIFMLQSARFYIFEYLTVRNYTALYPTGFQFSENSDYNTIRHCIIDVDSLKASSECIQSDGNVVPSGQGNNMNYCVFESNVFRNGGISLSGANDNAPDVGTRIINNTFLNIRFRAISSFSHNIAEVSGNKIYLRKTDNSNSGMYISGSKYDARITNNIIEVGSGAGISLFGVSGVNKPVLVANNIIYGKTHNGYVTEALQIGSCNKIDIFHNTVAISGINNKVDAFKHSGGTENRIRNNIFCHFSGGASCRLGGTSIAVLDNNNYYTTDSNLAYINTTPYKTLAAFKTATGKDANSTAVNPGFVSASDLHTFNYQIDNKGLYQSEVPVDAEGKPRSTSTPDPGAYEFSVKLFDANVSFVDPVIPVFGNNVVSFRIKNEGISSLNGKTLDLVYSTDGGSNWSAPESFTLSGLGSIYSSALYSFQAPWNISGPGSFRLCVKILNAASINDEDPANNQFCAPASCMGLGGNYTVGTGGDFPNIQQALDVLYGCGIGKDVTLNIVPGVYPEQIKLPAFKRNRPELSLTIRSSTGNAKDAVFTHLGSEGNTDFGTVQLIGAKHIILEALTITNTSSLSGAAIHLTEKSDSNIIRNCIINAHPEPASENVYGIIIDKNTLEFPNYDNYHLGSFNLFVNNILSGGYTGIHLRGGYGDGMYEKGKNIIRENKFFDVVENGIYIEDSRDVRIENNDISMKEESERSAGIHFRSIYSDYRITGNKVMNAGGRGISLDQCEAANYGLVANNTIGGEFRWKYASGLWVGYAKKVRVYHNSVYMNLPDSQSCAIDVNYFAAQVDVINNCGYHAGGGVAYRATPARVQVSDNNNWYSGGKYVAYWNTWTRTLEDLQAASGKDVSSISANPMYRSSIDLHIGNEELIHKGMQIFEVPKDIDGDTRDTLPTIGADEALLYDLAVKETLPSTASMGNVQVQVWIENRGVRSVAGSNISLSYSADGGQSWSVPELFPATELTAAYKTQLFTFTVPWTISDTLPKTLCIRLNKVLVDENQLNDTLCGNVCIASFAGGTFTVGGSSPDFANLTAAVDFLKSLSLNGCGIAGHIVFNIRPGIYGEQIVLDKLTGSGPNATITFQSETGKAPDVTLLAAPNLPANHAVIWLRGASYIRFKDLTLQNPASDYASGFAVSEDAAYNEIEGCRILLDTIGASEFVYGIMMDNINREVGQPAHHNKFSGNRISGGSYGIYLRGRNNTDQDKEITLADNYITHSYASGMMAEYHASLTGTGNTIVMRNNDTGIGISLRSCSNDQLIQSNLILNAGTAGISLSKVQSSAGSLVANNMVGGNFKTLSEGYGIYLSNCKVIDVIHNSLQYDKDGSFLSASLYAEPDNRDIRLFNNIFSNTGGGYACYIANSISITASNHNNFYASGNKLAYWEQDHLDLAELKTFTGKDINSLSVNPAFISVFDLHTFNPSLDGKAIPDNRIAMDIDGDPRNNTAPDIGADEYTVGKDGGVIAFNTIPDTVQAGSVYPVQVEVKNFGNTTLSGFNVRYQLNGILQADEPFTGTIAPGSTAPHSFATTFMPATPGTYYLKAYTLVSADLTVLNDTTVKKIVAVLKSGNQSEKSGSVVTVFPNPATDLIYISSQQVSGRSEIMLCDLTGRIVRSIKMESTLSVLGLQGLMPGNYLLKISNAQWVSYHKVLIIQ